jgi:hypothetical protein
MIGGLQRNERLQIQLYTTADYSTELDRYAANTKESPEITNLVRSELTGRFRKRMRKNELLRTTVRICLSTKLDRIVDDGHRVKGFEESFRVVKRSFDLREQYFDMLLRQYGGGVRSLDDYELLQEYLKYWSPGQAASDEFPSESSIDWDKPLSKLTSFGEMAPMPSGEQGLFLDNRYIGIMLYETLPASTWMKSMEPFFNLAIPNLRVILNIEAQPLEEAMQHERDRFKRLYANIKDRGNGAPDVEALIGVEQHKERLAALMSNQRRPCKAQIIVLAHDVNRDDLASKMEAIRTAIGKTDGKPYMPALSTSMLGFFNRGIPGLGPWIKYDDFIHKIADKNLCHLLPVGSTPHGNLSDASWIMDGDRNNLVGGRWFIGSTPSHCSMFGSTRTGKSALLQNLLMQSASELHFVALIDSGDSHRVTCQLLDPNCRPITIQANGNVTIDPFYTRELPLSPEHIRDVVSLVHLLVGKSSNEDSDKMREAILSHGVRTVYARASEKWMKHHPEEYYDVVKESLVIERYLEKFLDSKSDTFFDAFVALKIHERQKLEEVKALRDEIPDEEVQKRLVDQDQEYLVRNLTCSRWKPEEFPHLDALHDELKVMSIQSRHSRDLCATLALSLERWLRDGDFGPVVDGVSNVHFGDPFTDINSPLRVAYIEMGGILDSQKELRDVVGNIITNDLKNHILKIPRNLRKMAILEEGRAILEIPKADQMIVDYHQRMGKYNCAVVTLFQEYGGLLSSKPEVAKAIMSNTNLTVLLRNQNREDLNILGQFFPIPEAVKETVAKFPDPRMFKEGDKDAYAGFVWADRSGSSPKFTVCRSYLSDLVMYITSSTGEMYERKKKELRNSKSLLEAVRKYAAQKAA